MTLHRFLAALLCACAIALSSCTSSIFPTVYPTLVDGQYDTEFPYRGCADQLKEIAESVKMVSSVAYYRTFAFTRGEAIRIDSLIWAIASSMRPSSTIAGPANMKLNDMPQRLPIRALIA